MGKVTLLTGLTPRLFPESEFRLPLAVPPATVAARCRPGSALGGSSSWFSAGKLADTVGWDAEMGGEASGTELEVGDKNPGCCKLNPWQFAFIPRSSG